MCIYPGQLSGSQKARQQQRHMLLPSDGGEALRQGPAIGSGGRQTRQLGMGSYAGDLRQGSDGRIYRWIGRSDGLGNTAGFWTTLPEKGRQAWRRLVEKIRALLAGGILSN